MSSSVGTGKKSIRSEITQASESYPFNLPLALEALEH